MLGRRDKTTTRSPATTGALAPSNGVNLEKPGGKGRPTPKRSEAEKQRRTRVTAPKGRKEAYRRQREDARFEREHRRKAMLAGDPRALPARDKGPVRAYVRDAVDARRSIAEFFIVVAVIVLAASLVPAAPQVKAAGFYVWAVMLLLIIVDSVVLGLRLRKALIARFPNENRKGAVAYGLMRSSQLRRLRIPKPRVKPGAGR